MTDHGTHADTAPLDTAQLRSWARWCPGQTNLMCLNHLLHRAADEIDRLRAEDVLPKYRDDWLAMKRRAKDAEARLVEQQEHAATVHAEWVRIEAELTARAEAAEVERDEHRSERHRLMKLISVRESAWEAAEARLAAVEALADEMATWCSPHGVAVDYAQRVRAAARGEAPHA